MSDKILHVNIEEDTKINKCYRKSIYSDKTMQIILQNLKPGENVPFETHTVTQFLRCEYGSGYVVIDDKIYDFYDGVAITIPYGSRHKIVNNSNSSLKFYTIYPEIEHEDDIC